MKIVIADDITLYLSKPYIKNVNLKDRVVAEEFINGIIVDYNIDLSGYLDIKIYIDSHYGVIICISKDNSYFDYFSDDLVMNIEIFDDLFLYKIDDIYLIKSILDGVKLFEYDGEIYARVVSLSDFQMGILLENSSVIYGRDVKKIMINKVNLEVRI